MGICSQSIPKWLKYTVYSCDLLFNITCAVLFLIPLHSLVSSSWNADVHKVKTLIARDACIVCVQCALVIAALVGTLTKKDGAGRTYWPTLLNHVFVGISLFLLNQKLSIFARLCKRKETAIVTVELHDCEERKV